LLAERFVRAHEFRMRLMHLLVGFWNHDVAFGIRY
jgi:hypothetical protein